MASNGPILTVPSSSSLKPIGTRRNVMSYLYQREIGKTSPMPPFQRKVELRQMLVKMPMMRDNERRIAVIQASKIFRNCWSLGCTKDGSFVVVLIPASFQNRRTTIALCRLTPISWNVCHMIHMCDVSFLPNSLQVTIGPTSSPFYLVAHVQDRDHSDCHHKCEKSESIATTTRLQVPPLKLKIEWRATVNLIERMHQNKVLPKQYVTGGDRGIILNNGVTLLALSFILENENKSDQEQDHRKVWNIVESRGSVETCRGIYKKKDVDLGESISIVSHGFVSHSRNLFLVEPGYENLAKSQGVNFLPYLLCHSILNVDSMIQPMVEKFLRSSSDFMGAQYMGWSDFEVDVCSIVGKIAGIIVQVVCEIKMLVNDSQSCENQFQLFQLEFLWDVFVGTTKRCVTTWVKRCDHREAVINKWWPYANFFNKVDDRTFSGDSRALLRFPLISSQQVLVPIRREALKWPSEDDSSDSSGLDD